jgi:hypothetical protein
MLIVESNQNVCMCIMDSSSSCLQVGKSDDLARVIVLIETDDEKFSEIVL